MRLSTPQPGTVYANQVQLVAAGDGAYALWHDDRNGPTDIHFTIPLGFQPYGSATTGSGGFAPGLRATELPLLGSTVPVQIHGGAAGAGGALLLGLGPGSQTALSLFGGTVLVQPAATLPFALGRTGFASVPLAVPATTAFLGWNVNLQAILLDADASGGLSMTNGLEMWLG